MLTIRMAVVAIVGLYTSRVVLQALGVEDFGIYGLAGGIVGMVTFINGSLGGATTRFITYEIGAGNNENLKKVFSTSFIIHLCIAVLCIIIAETLGLWFLHNKLVIPEGRMHAAEVVYQLSIVSLAINFTQVPYTAIIVAYERLNIYAYFEIINVILKLAVVYALLIVNGEKLILYAALMFVISVITALAYRWYCIKCFPESHLTFRIDKAFAKRMLTFSGYNLFGNMSVMVYLQGLPIVLNLFLGVIANAASNIGTTVTGVVKGFAWAISSAFTPQITKQYAAGNITNMETMMCRSILFTALIFGICAMPFFIETERVIYLWLGQIPEYSIIFLRSIMIVTIVDYITMTNNSGIHATGNIRRVSLVGGWCYLICPFAAYGIMKLGGPVYTPYAINTIMLIVISGIGFYLLKDQIPAYNIRKYVSVIIKSYGILILNGIAIKIILDKIVHDNYPVKETSFGVSIVILGLTFILSFILISTSSYFFVLNHSEKDFLRTKISNFRSRYLESA